MKLGIIIQARTASTRMEKKVLKKFENGLTLIEIIIDKLKKKYANLYPIVLATSTSNDDFIFSEIAQKNDILFFRGDELNVLMRFKQTCEKFGFTHFVRICSDNPFLDVDYIEALIFELKSNISLDYVSFKLSNNLPSIKSHQGIFVEIGSLNAIKRVEVLTKELVFFDNLTQFIYQNPNLFNIRLIEAPKILFDRFDIRLTLDDQDDYIVINELYNKLKSFNPKLDNLIQCIDSDNDLKQKMISNIKKHIK
jgi:spore coat polysaccharide biosynthesis protein SpsF